MFEINMGNFLASLPMMLYGMGGIFIVILVIMAVIKILTKLFPADKEE